MQQKATREANSPAGSAFFTEYALSALHLLGEGWGLKWSDRPAGTSQQEFAGWQQKTDGY
jgi:hypothetical protein